mgnify:CR=1 FL=1
MRNVVIILLAFVIGVNCFSQTKQPVKQKLNYLGNLIYLDENSDFHQNSFVLGWHWYSGYKMSSALSVNQIHVSSEVPKYEFGPLRYLNPEIDRIAHNANMTLTTPWISSNHWVGYPVAYNIAFLYEPTYKVDLSKPAESFVPRQYDTTRYAFGFGTVRGFIDNTYGNENYDRLQLFNNDSIRNQVVLADPWVCNDLATIIAPNEIVNKIITNIDTIYNIYNKSIPQNYLASIENTNPKTDVSKRDQGSNQLEITPSQLHQNNLASLNPKLNFNENRLLNNPTFNQVYDTIFFIRSYDSKFRFEFKNTPSWFSNSPIVQPNRLNSFNNLSVSLSYPVYKTLILGTEFRQETFYVQYDGKDNSGQDMTFYQQPNVSTFGITLRYSPFDIGNRIKPFGQLALGGNSVGFGSWNE